MLTINLSFIQGSLLLSSHSHPLEAPDAEIQLVDSQAQTSGVGGMFPQKSFKIGLSETQFSEFPGDQNWLTLKILKALKITTKNENIINLAIIIELPDITCQTT